jgi:HK97 family phage portal protein
MRLWPWSKTGREAKSSNTWQVFREHFESMGLATSGSKVTRTTALQVTTAFACARLIAEGLAQVPWKIHQQQGDKREDAVNHPLYWLIAKRPNDLQTSFEFREQISLHLCFCFESFIFINRSRDGRILELLPFAPNSVTVKKQADHSLRYTVAGVDGAQIDIPPAQMWHIRGPSWTTGQSLDGIRLAREALGLALATEEHSARMFSNGAKVGGIVATDQVLNEAQLKLLRDAWQAAQGGNANAYKTAFMYGGIKYTPTGMPNDQAQLLEQRRFQVEEICRFYRVMPIMVGAGDKSSTYASAEQMFIAHVTHTLMPWYRRIEDSADVHLLGLDAVRQGYYTKFNANGLLRGSAQARGDYYTKLYNIGVMNPNEIRALEELNPYDGGEKYRVPLNMVDPKAEPDPVAPGGANPKE